MSEVQYKLYPADNRGFADHGWLKARHSFSFGGWYDPEKIHFGLLRVLNDDIVAPGMGFPTHPHDNICLLYTSPSPRDKRQSRMPSSA